MATLAKLRKVKNALITLVNLRPEEVLHLSKPRPGFLDYAEALVALLDTHGDEIVVKGVTFDEARAQIDAYLALLQIERAAKKQLRMARATRALRGSKLWDLMLRIYAHACIAGRDNVELLRVISPFEHFMKTGPRKKPTGVTASAM